MVHGTVTNAAAALQMSQPAATSMLRALERSLGFMLFERRANRLLPSPEAVALYTRTPIAHVGVSISFNRLYMAAVIGDLAWPGADCPV